MKYELRENAVNFSAETALDGEKYSCTITIGLRCVDGVGPDFSKDIVVISDNEQTGYDVDNQRQEAIDDFINEINK